MASRLRPLRVLLPVGILSGCVAASRRSSRYEVGCDGDGTGAVPAAGRQKDDGHAAESDTLSTNLVKQLEAWLMPSDGSDSLGRMVEEMRDVLGEEIQISADEGKHLPMNFLMVKAMHDHERLAKTRSRKSTSRNRIRGGLSPRDRTILQRSAHFARFAAASYDSVVDTVKELVAEGETSPPPNLLYQSTDDVRKWCIGKRTRIDPDDVKEVAVSDSLEARTYFVAVDHVSRSVVVSIRGTYSFTDTMADLLCDPVDYAGGKAHRGISRSAMRLWKTVHAQVEEQLREHRDYKLVLTGHSLGAGTAILLKILLSRNATQVLSGGANSTEGGKTKIVPALAKLDVGRPVRVECYAFAPPPVFVAPVGAAWMQDVYSFVNGSDCVPTMSLGSIYSLFRTIRNVDQLPLDVYKRIEFILDSRVRVQQSEQGVEAEDGKHGRREIAQDILRLRALPSFLFGAGAGESNGYDGEIEPAEDDVDDIWSEKEEDEPWEVATSEGEQGNASTADANAEDLVVSAIDAIRAEFRSRMSILEGDWSKFTQDVGEAAQSLFDAVNEAGSFLEGVGRLTTSVCGMTSDEVALTALLLKELEVGGGPSMEQVLTMVKKCERDGYRPGGAMFRRHKAMTVGDLIIPGNVYLLEGWQAEAGNQQAGSKKRGSEKSGSVRKNIVSVRRTSSAELGGVRLSNNMIADHSMNAYEPAIIAAAKRYQRRSGDGRRSHTDAHHTK